MSSCSAPAPNVRGVVVLQLGNWGDAAIGTLPIQLVTGAAGGVGIAALQYAEHLGAEIVALVSSETKTEAIRKVGAD